jgi:hypothetical protein
LLLLSLHLKLSRTLRIRRRRPPRRAHLVRHNHPGVVVAIYSVHAVTEPSADVASATACEKRERHRAQAAPAAASISVRVKPRPPKVTEHHRMHRSVSECIRRHRKRSVCRRREWRAERARSGRGARPIEWSPT